VAPLFALDNRRQDPDRLSRKCLDRRGDLARGEGCDTLGRVVRTILYPCLGIEKREG
jgi:hypothetical protein